MCESNSSEDMASSDILPVQNGTLESFDSSEFSLIPEQPLEDSSPLQQSAHSGSLHAALMSATFDLSEEEIQKRLVELAEDNRSLRESLQSSSAIMKSELSAIASWHNNITTTIAQHQISLQEAQAKVQELEGEKAELLEKLQEKEKEIEEDSQTPQKIETAILSDEDSEYEIIQKKSKDTESLKSHLKDAELNISCLKQEIEEQNLKIESMKNIFEENEKEKNDLKSKLVNQDELNSKLCDLLRQMASSEETNNALEEKIKQLEEKLKSQPFAPAIPMNDELLLNLSEEHQEKLKALKEGNEKVVRELDAKVKELEGKLNYELRASEAGRIKNLEDKKILIVLQSNYDRVTKILQMQTRNQKQKAESMDSERGEVTKKNREQVDSLTARLFDFEQRLEEREAKVVALNNELSLAKEVSDQPPILKAQVEVLKIDLDNAVLAKEAALEEVQQMSQQLRELQAQSMASFCSNCGAGSAHSESPSRGSRGKRRANKQSDNQPRSGPELFVCPICQFGFTELHALENHVNHCLDKAQ